jgi:hypothetical protein
MSEQLSYFLARHRDINSPFYILNAYHSRATAAHCTAVQQNITRPWSPPQSFSLPPDTTAFCHRPTQ